MHDINDSTDAAMFIVLTYQAWCGERVESLDRARSITHDVMKMIMTCPTKTGACQWLASEGWSDGPKMRKRLVDSLWPGRDSIVRVYQIATAKRIMGG